MKVLEFETHLNPERTLSVPAGVVQQIQGAAALRVVLFVADAAEDRSWDEVTAKQFLSSYSDADAIYDQL